MKTSTLALSLFALASPALSQSSLEGKDPRGMHDLFGTALTSANAFQTGREPYGASSAGAWLLSDVSVGPTDGVSDELDAGLIGEVMGRDFYLLGRRANNTMGLMKTSGTPGGTSVIHEFPMLGELVGGTVYYYDYVLNAAGLAERLVFSARDTSTTWALWSTDGTSTGLLNLGATSAQVFNFIRLNNRALYVEPGSGFLTSTDGVVKDVVYDFGALGLGVDQYSFTVVGDDVYFGVSNGPDTMELWRTDGTTAGTSRVYDVSSGAAAVFDDIADIVAVQDAVYFTALDGVGRAVWRTDGTTVGTELVARIAGGHETGPRSLTALGDLLLFQHVVPGSIDRLYVYDHTPPTRTVLGEFKASSGFIPQGIRDLTAVGTRRVFFRGESKSGAGSTLGSEAWVSDGTVAGTELFADLIPGFSSGSPREFLLSDGKLFFVGRDAPQAQNALHHIDVGATAQVVGVGCSTSGRIPRLTTDDPVLGGTTTLRLEGAEPSASVTVIVGPRSAPTSLGSGCFTHVDLASASFTALGTTDSSGAWEVPAIPVPADMVLDGAQVMLQVIVSPSATPPFGVDLSNGVLFTLGE